MATSNMSIGKQSTLNLQLRVNGGEFDEPERAKAKKPSKIAKKARVYPAAQPDWSNLNCLHRNTLPPRSYFFLYDSEKAALKAAASHDLSESKSQLLSGTWKFDLSSSPFEGPIDFHSPDYDTSDWADIKVPGMWQCQGFGKGPQYTNVDFPWPVDPPNIPFDDNECGRYVTMFHVKRQAEDYQTRLRFEGVDAAFTVWVNGFKLGYSQGSRNPSEFDITDVIQPDKKNILAVEVYQRCDGSYIEDQV